MKNIILLIEFLEMRLRPGHDDDLYLLNWEKIANPVKEVEVGVAWWSKAAIPIH